MARLWLPRIAYVAVGLVAHGVKADLFDSFANAVLNKGVESTTVGGIESSKYLDGSVTGSVQSGVGMATSALGSTVGSTVGSTGSLLNPSNLNPSNILSGNPSSLLSTDVLNTAAGGLSGVLSGDNQQLGTGLSWNFGSSMNPVAIGTYLAMQFLSPVASEDSAVKVAGNVLMSGDPSVAAAAFGKTLTSLDLTCAWQASFGGDAINLNFHDGNEVLHVQFIPTSGASSYHISGQYPKARSFSYATYLMSMTSTDITFVDELTDKKIVPTTGVNPMMVGEGEGTYDIYVTPDGNRGFANELKYKADGVLSYYIIIVYRLYKVDQVVNLLNFAKSKTDNWGQVPAPILRVELISNSLLKSSYYFNMQPCNQTRNNENIQKFITETYNFKEGAGGVTVSCKYSNIPNNFVYYDDAQKLRSLAENHIMACGDTTAVPYGASPIMFIRGRLPPPSKARYISFSLVDLMPPGKNVATLTDQTLRNYAAYQGKSDIDYTIVVGQTRLTLAACGFDSDKLLSQGIYPFTYGGTTIGSLFAHTNYPGVVYREVLTGGYEESLQQTRYACEEAKDCSNPRFFQGNMGKYYPSITWAYCPLKPDANADIKFIQLTPKNVTIPPPKLPTPAPTGMWEQLSDAAKGSCSPYITVNVTSLKSSEVYVDGQLVGKSTDAPDTATSNNAVREWSPIQAIKYNASAHEEGDQVETYTYTDVTGQNVTLEILRTPSDFMPDKVLVATKVPVMGGRPFFATYDLCGYKRASAAGWKCSVGPFSDANWTKTTYDDSNWQWAKAFPRSKTCLAINSDCGDVPRDAQGMSLDTCGGGSPTGGFLYCRTWVPQKCDLTCSAGSDDRLTARCPDKNNAVVVSRMASSSLFWLYSNGEQVGADLTLLQSTRTDMFILDPNQAKIVLAFKATDDTKKGIRSYLQGEIDVCGTKVLTDTKWKCAPSEPKTLEWTKPGFDDSTWNHASIVNGLGQPPQPAGISRGATWIWAPNGASSAWCRIEVSNPVHDAATATS